MTTKIKQALIGGIIGTAVMTKVTMIAPMIGMPKMSPPEMLSMMTGFPIIISSLAAEIFDRPQQLSRVNKVIFFI